MATADTEPAPLLSTTEVARRLNISPRAVRRLTAEGLLTYVQVTGTAKRVSEHDLADYIARNRRQATAPSI